MGYSQGLPTLPPASLCPTACSFWGLFSCWPHDLDASCLVTHRSWAPLSWSILCRLFPVWEQSQEVCKGLHQYYLFFLLKWGFWKWKSEVSQAVFAFCPAPSHSETKKTIALLVEIMVGSSRQPSQNLGLFFSLWNSHRLNCSKLFCIFLSLSHTSTRKKKKGGWISIMVT